MTSNKQKYILWLLYIYIDIQAAEAWISMCNTSAVKQETWLAAEKYSCDGNVKNNLIAYCSDNSVNHWSQSKAHTN